jgi:two-component system chemotaxis response regulator CheB
MDPSSPLRVVVADDSAFMRRLLSDALGRSGFEVLAAVEDGDEALTACRSFRPDVLTLDLAMPGLDGIGVLRALRESKLGTPVVVVSAFSPAHGARAVDALAEGAIELVAKPAAGESVTGFVAELSEKVKAAAGSRTWRPAPARVEPRANGRPAVRRARAVVIACSTGGPRALADLMPALPSPLGVGAVVVQHMPAGFTRSLAERLDRSSPLHVREAEAGDRVEPGTALLAPGGSHLRIRSDRTAELSDAPAVGGLRPRADITIADAAKVFGSDLLLVVLTGMGRDGAEGARAVKAAGGRVLVEAESSCTVYGMPRAVVEEGLADGIYDLSALGAAVVAEAGR